MLPNNFFIDTADVKYVSDLLELFGRDEDIMQRFAGVTTNPSAMHKMNITTLGEYESNIVEMRQVLRDQWAVSNVESIFLLYVQMPRDDLSQKELINWVHFLRDLNADSDNRSIVVGLKIPPYHKYLRFAAVIPDLFPNVTGIADAGTIHRVLGYEGVAFASLIPGRMEEVGIDATHHMQNLMGNTGDHVITGSMRTLEGVQRAINCGTTPTIGTRVFDIIRASASPIDTFKDLWMGPSAFPVDTPPITDQRNIDLSANFFKEMNEKSAAFMTSVNLNEPISTLWSHG